MSLFIKGSSPRIPYRQSHSVTDHGLLVPVLHKWNAVACKAYRFINLSPKNRSSREPQIDFLLIWTLISSWQCLKERRIKVKTSSSPAQYSLTSRKAKTQSHSRLNRRVWSECILRKLVWFWDWSSWTKKRMAGQCQVCLDRTLSRKLIRVATELRSLKELRNLVKTPG